jgi:nitrogen fixation NifU-like protein
MEISLVVKNDTIKDMGYQCKSCVYCQASVSLLSRKIKNKSIEEIEDFVANGEKLFDDVKVTLEKHWKEFKIILDKKNLARKECLLLPLRTILKALKI